MGKIWVALAVVDAELLLLGWLVGIHVWKLIDEAVTG